MMQFKNIAQFFHRTIFINIKPRLLVLGFFLYTPLLFPNTTLQSLSQSYDLEKISKSFTWFRLMDQKNLDQNKAEYFLTNNGSKDINHLSELRESLKLLTGKDSEVLKFHCRFPARTIYLQSIFKEIPKLAPKNCPKYFAWTKENSIKSISFIFVNGYLENPASFFGHTLLKFNTNEKNDNLFLLDSALNYGANTNNDPALPYVVRGLFGKYKASLKAENFFRISAMYQEFQMRDMWEYTLQISDYQKNLITAFTYEMLEKEYQYYFLSDNCAYRINRIIGLATGIDPMPNLPWSSPIDLLHGLKNKNLISAFNYFPSQHTKALLKIRTLSPDERSDFYKFENNDMSLSSISNATKIALLEDLNYQKLKAFKKGKKDILIEIDNQRKDILLSIDGNYKAKENYQPLSPTESNLPTLIKHGLGYINKSNFNKSESFYTLGLRGSNFSLLENDEYRTRNSEFKFLSSELSMSKHGLRIHDLTIFKILSANDRDLYLRNESVFSWGVEVGRRQIDGSCFPCGQNYASGQLGKGFYVNSSTTALFLSHLTLHDNKKLTGNLSTGISLMLIKRNENNKYLFKYHDTNYSEFNRWDNETYGFVFEKSISQSQALNISFKKNKFANEVLVSLKKYY